MPLPVAHALVGASAALALWPRRDRAAIPTALAAGALLGICPDFDYALNWVRVFGKGWHHGFTHSLLFAAVAGAATAWLLGLRGWRGVLACSLAIAAHSLLDYLFTESNGIALLWPVTDHRYKLGWGSPIDYEWRGDSLWETAGALVRISLLELVLFGPLLALSSLQRRRP